MRSAYVEYRKALTEISPATKSRIVSSQLATQVFSDDPVTSQAPFFIADRALEKWRRAVSPQGRIDKTVQSLIRGSLDYLWSFVVGETACNLQREWERRVYAKVEGLSPRIAQKRALGDGGLVWRFVDDPAAPFIDQEPGKGYMPKKVLKRSIPFDQAFLNYLTKGARGGSGGGPTQYRVTMMGLPTGSEPATATKPEETRLQLKCESGVQSMPNLGIPVSQVFKWSPETCGDVILEIDVGDVTLTKKYEGELAFRKFLLDFPKGYHTFTPKDFPVLRDMGIKTITVRYRFKGDWRNIINIRPVQTPRKIVACWGQS